MSSVRPLTSSEQKHARGEPLASYSAFFGLTTGIMMHLRMHGIKANQTWFPNAQAKSMGLILIVGGLFGGYWMGTKAFGDEGLARLAQRHELDKATSKF